MLFFLDGKPAVAFDPYLVVARAALDHQPARLPPALPVLVVLGQALGVDIVVEHEMGFVFKGGPDEDVLVLGIHGLQVGQALLVGLDDPHGAVLFALGLFEDAEFELAVEIAPQLVQDLFHQTFSSVGGAVLKLIVRLSALSLMRCCSATMFDRSRSSLSTKGLWICRGL